MSLDNIFASLRPEVMEDTRTASHTPVQRSTFISSPRAPSYLDNRLLGYVTIEDIEPKTDSSGDGSPKP